MTWKSRTYRMPAMSISSAKTRSRKLLKTGLWSVLIILVLLAATFGLTRAKPKELLAKAQLADGRTLQIEGVTYGTKHRMGNVSSTLVNRLYHWLPAKLVQRLEPKDPQSTIDGLPRPALVVWVNAVDSITGANVDCQGIRMELVDEHGDVFAEGTRYWSSFNNNFYRVGHVFYSFPRTAKKFTVQITPWKTNETARVELGNPHVIITETWAGNALPQQKRIGDIDVVLTELAMQTNGSPKKNWETRLVYWKPVWELRRNGEKLSGWRAPDWMAEDPTGNKDQYLGVRQPVLKYSATFYPSPTNAEVAVLIETLPETAVTNLQSSVWWNKKSRFEMHEILVLGLFPVGTQMFSEGSYQTNPPVKFGATRGGAPSGWVSGSHPVNALKEQMFHGHYSTKNPVIYVKVPELGEKRGVAVRLRDEQGRYYVAEMEPEGAVEGIHPYIVKLPAGVKSVVPEIVVLKPVEAEFMVKVPEVGK
ncbi:MAG: hypothetical protein JWQ71_1090 [Pedosphaera sp.]|nr:hypothetical protein [Pedosphaera sp.]